jgi:glutathione S-transferase
LVLKQGMASIRVTAFRWVPPFAQGLVRDLRVRWALEEAGLAYEENLIGRDDQASPAYRAKQPFGQVPVYEEDGLVLFESGAIVLHVAERSEKLMPKDPKARARVIAWIFAALNTIEVHVGNLLEVEAFAGEAEWAKARRPVLVERVTARLEVLSNALGKKDYIEERFTAADILLTTVLRIVRPADFLATFPNLAAYKERCEARPAFKKALADQLAPFAKNAPPA